MSSNAKTHLTDVEWETFQLEGYLRLGRVMDDAELGVLGQRIDDIMLGNANVDYDRIQMQLDRDPDRDGKPGPQSRGHKGSTLLYRKVQQLEYDPDYLRYMRKPLMRDICARAYGEETDIACFRAMFMNKPAHEGTDLPWHQDRWKELDRDPRITVWAALNDATVANGCVKIIPRSHHALINPESGSGFLTPLQIEEWVATREAEYLELKAGEGVLLHNWTLHSSEVNRTAVPRRAFSVCYLDAATQSAKGHSWEVIFGENALVLDEKTSLFRPG